MSFYITLQSYTSATCDSPSYGTSVSIGWFRLISQQAENDFYKNIYGHKR